jgi:uncharacterized protein YecE (DUF72 family)
MRWATKPVRSCFIAPAISCQCLTAGIVLQIAVEETPLQFRISSSKLVHATDTQTAIRSKHLALPFGSSRRTGPWKRTADFVYIRGHGPGGRYKGHYRPAALAYWSPRIRCWKKQGYDVYMYFDNAAPADALKLAQLLK